MWRGWTTLKLSGAMLLGGCLLISPGWTAEPTTAQTPRVTPQAGGKPATQSPTTQTPATDSSATSNASRSGANEVPAAEVRDVMLLLPTGPAHLRFHITLDGDSLSKARERYLDRLLKQLDTNGDGKLSAAEAERSPLLTTQKRKSSNEFLDSLPGRKEVTRAEIVRSVERVAGTTVAYRQDDSAADSDLEVFKLLDGDASGLLDRSEIQSAARRIGRLDADRDQCISFDEFLPPRVEPNAAQLVAPADDPTRPQEKFADLLRDTREPLLPQRLMKMYDRNRSGTLSPKELNWSAARCGPIDANGDGQLQTAELAHLGASAVDAELLVEISESETNISPLRRLPPTEVSQSGDAAAGVAVGSTATGSGALRKNDAAQALASESNVTELPGSKRTDVIRLELPGGTRLTFSFRKVDPVKTAVDNALQQFNLLDLDANGYLDRMEIAERPRFERYLFDAIDTDSDDKLFAEEMRRYVVARCEPVATSCQVNLYDTGHGFFQVLDASGDGRISIRELRGMEQSLSRLTKPGRPTIAPTDTGRHYRIEFVRSSFQLFGRSERMITQLPGFLQPPSSGPIWFQRMDRNGDGDVNWNEFLGPRNVFDALDMDHDGLLDPREAERALPARKGPN